MRFIRERDLVHKGQSVLLAISGGVDSMVMLSLFDQARTTWELRLAVAHVNHQLRGEESEDDEVFVRREAEKRGLPFYSKKVDTIDCAHKEHLSKQEAARILRYEYLEEVRRLAGADRIATAHQANDNAETVLMNILRGTGARGLSGIPLTRDTIIRPLLFAYREEIEEFAGQNKVDFRNDSSNKSTDYTRNSIRLDVIPYLEETLGHGVVRSLNEMSHAMRELNSVLDETVRIKFRSLMRIGSHLSLEIDRLLIEKSLVQSGIILELLRFIGVEQNAEKVESILSLCGKSTGSRLSLGKGWTIFRNRDRLILKKDRAEYTEECPVEIGRKYSFKTFSFSISPPGPSGMQFSHDKFTEVVDAEKLGTSLVLRRWRSGDWFVPLGFGHKKKLSDFFVDEKVPLLEKFDLPLLESAGDIVWVCGRRLDDRFKVTDNTQTVVRLTYLPINL